MTRQRGFECVERVIAVAGNVGLCQGVIQGGAVGLKLYDLEMRAVQSLGSIAEYVVFAALKMHGASHTSRNKSMMVRGTSTVVIGSEGLQQRHDAVCGVAVGDEAHAAMADI